MVPHLKHLKCIIYKCSNLLRALAGTWWGAHPSSFLLVFKSIICSKVDYGSFLFGYAFRTHRNKLNAMLTFYLRIVIGAVRSAPNICLEVECVCSPMGIWSRQFAGKFLLKHISNSPNSIYKKFSSLATRWRYVPKTFPILASIAFYINHFTSSVFLPQKRLNSALIYRLKLLHISPESTYYYFLKIASTIMIKLICLHSQLITSLMNL